jgi:hypothetical protein
LGLPWPKNRSFLLKNNLKINIMKPKFNYKTAKSSPKKRGRKRWLSKELYFTVDAKRIINFPDGKTSNLIPLTKWRNKIPYKVAHCDREGNVLAKVS